MRRDPAFDPPEYLDWQADETLLREYARAVEEAGGADGLGRETLLELYRDLLRTRLHDITLKRWVHTGVIPRAWLGTGEEAVTVGAVAALDRDRDLVLPMIRNAGALPMMGMPLADVLRGCLGTPDSPNRGRDLHVGDRRRGIVQPTSHTGSNVPVMAGVALFLRKRGEDRVALTWVGGDATRTAAFHEGINFAAVQNLPMVVVIQSSRAVLEVRPGGHGAPDPARIPGAYGLPGECCDGNNVLHVRAACRRAVARCREGGGPAVVVAETFRMGGDAAHEESETRPASPPELFEWWGRRDPIGMYEAWLGLQGVSDRELGAVERAVVGEFDAATDEALESRRRTPRPADAQYGAGPEGGTLVGLEHRPI